MLKTSTVPDVPLSLVGDEPREPGRPKGRGKVPGSGRKKGSVNKFCGETRAFIEKKGKPISFLCDVAAGRKVRVGMEDGRAVYHRPTFNERMHAAEKLAAKILPDLRATELSGPDGAPIQTANLIADVSNRVASVFADVAQQGDVANTLGDDEMEAVMAVNFLHASREAASPAGGSTTECAPSSGATPAPLFQARHDDLAHTPELAPPSPAEPATPDVPGTLEVGHEINLGPFTIRCRRPQRAGLPPCLEALDRHGMFLRNVTSVKAGIRFLHEKFPETRDEAVEIRQTPSAHHTSHHGADQRRPSDPLPVVHRRR